YQLVKNNYVQSQWGQWYMFGDDGKIVSGLYQWCGTWYYFDPISYQVVKGQTVNLGNARYSIDNNGAIVSVLNNAVALSQLPQLPTGCEMTAVTMMLQYAGINVSKEQVANQTPRSNNPYCGFVGNPYSNVGYGLWVAPGGISSVVAKYLGHSLNMSGWSIESIKNKLINQHLVVVWQAHMHGFGTHAITLTGYDSNGFYYNDPWTGQKNAFMSFSTFDWNWRDDPATRGALSY
uniref:C39 family peptidase n=1 Tax=uncultured Limosilactobacillus sp. TaxID=2837629 RepID=UPI0025D5EACF